MDSKDRNLGMQRRITRRDFLNGAAVTASGLMAAKRLLAADAFEPETAANYYPPTRTGMRGDHDEIYKTPHSVRDGTFWQHAGTPTDTGERYDLVIVGGGISGLAAAHFYRKSEPHARILILENHDDFGGHAKRNEFHQTGRMLLGYGGTFSIESPSPYSPVAKALIHELGIDVGSFKRDYEPSVYRSRGLRAGIFFDKETWGTDKLVASPVGDWEDEEEADGSGEGRRWKAFFEDAPMPEQAKQDLRRLYTQEHDYLAGLSSSEKKTRMASMSYARFLVDCAGVHGGVVKLMQARPYSLFGVGIDAVSAQDAWGLGFPGFKGMKLDSKPGPGQNRDAIRSPEAEAYFFHFPDGNSSIARLLVRSLLPAAVPGHNATDIVEAHTNFGHLDRAGSPMRIRLNSTVVRVAHDGEPAQARSVSVTYMRGGALKTVRAGKCILACWHVMIPYICTELPPEQKKALAFAVKVPLVYTNVVINNWTAFDKVGIHSVYAPGSFHSELSLDMPVNVGAYQCSRDPKESVVVHMERVPCQPGLPARDQHRAGRRDLFETSFETFERNIRDQLARTVGAGGFDPARDIAAITVNRWPHGYAYQYNSLWDKFWLDGEAGPCSTARQPYGRIAIANSDAGAYAYTDCAIDQGYRAAREVLSLT